MANAKESLGRREFKKLLKYIHNNECKMPSTVKTALKELKCELSDANCDYSYIKTYLHPGINSFITISDNKDLRRLWKKYLAALSHVVSNLVDINKLLSPDSPYNVIRQKYTSVFGADPYFQQPEALIDENEYIDDLARQWVFYNTIASVNTNEEVHDACVRAMNRCDKSSVADPELYEQFKEYYATNAEFISKIKSA